MKCMVLACFTVPSATPTNVSGSVINSTALRLTWESPPVDQLNGILRGYVVNVTEVETGRKFQYSTDTPEIVLSSLHPSYTYVCVVAAVTVGNGLFSLNVTIRTEEAGTCHHQLLT